MKVRLLNKVISIILIGIILIEIASISLASPEVSVPESPGTTTKRHAKLKLTLGYKKHTTDKNPNDNQGYKLLIFTEVEGKVKRNWPLTPRDDEDTDYWTIYLKDVGGKTIRAYADTWSEDVSNYYDATAYGKYKETGTAKASGMNSWGYWTIGKLLYNNLSKGVWARPSSGSETKTVSSLSPWFGEGTVGYEQWFPWHTRAFASAAFYSDSYLELIDYTRTISVDCIDQFGTLVPAKFTLKNSVDINGDGKPDGDGIITQRGIIYYVWPGTYDYEVSSEVYYNEWMKWTFSHIEAGGANIENSKSNKGKITINDDAGVHVYYTCYYKVVINSTDGGYVGNEKGGSIEGVHWRVANGKVKVYAYANLGFVFKKFCN